MPTPAERQALLFVAAVAALGVGVRGCRALEPTATATDRADLAVQMAAVDSAVAAGGARRPTASRRGQPAAPRAAPPKAAGADAAARKAAARKAAARNAAAPLAAAADPVNGRPALRAGARPAVDVDVASASELDQLPGIGPALAGRIVADREARGPFGSMRGLDRVKGIGPALAAKLAPHVTFSLSPRPSDTEVPPGERVSSP